ncbi:MAG: DUF480 domain-containing protein [Planctomycetota bacterium]|nr:DUF480 domain-containing protein [Planctomycetota bacterium]
MSIALDLLEQRIIGSLIEKELTTPDQYPLTLNALQAACTQKSNRDPQMDVESYEIEGALRALMDRGWVTRQELVGSRTMRYSHEAASQLGVGKPELAILSELLCRGPQAPGALKTRCSRMQPFASPEEVEDRLAEMSIRPVPYVVELERQPRERQARWQHMLGKAQQSLGVATDREPTPHADPRPQAPVAAPVRAPAPVSAPPAQDAGLTDDLAERLEALEREVETLRERLDRLEGR